MRSPAVTRLYLQVPDDERIEDWPDDRIWDELAVRLPTSDDFKFNTGPLLEKGITAMRSFVATPMRHGNLLLAGDAAHIVPPTGAKGMNLAIADVSVMAGVIDDALRGGRPERLDDYTATCLQRVWRAQQFSYWMTSMLHRFGDDPFHHQLQLSELALVTGSQAAATNLAQNYVGLPFGPLYGGVCPMTTTDWDAFASAASRHPSAARLAGVPLDGPAPSDPSAHPSRPGEGRRRRPHRPGVGRRRAHRRRRRLDDRARRRGRRPADHRHRPAARRRRPADPGVTDRDLASQLVRALPPPRRPVARHP